MSTWTDVENGIKLKLPDAGINVISPQRLREAIQLVINQIIASTPDPVEFEWKATDDQNNSVTYEIGDPVIDDNRWFIAIAQNSNKKPVLPDGSINDAFWREENASTTRYIDNWEAKLFTYPVEIVLYNKKLYLLDRTVVGSAPYESTDIAAEIALDPSPWFDLSPASPGGGGGIDPSKIVNDFSTDPNDTSKVAGADAVYQLFQILASNDVDYDTLQEIVDFIKTIDTDGELVSVIDTAVGGNWWRTDFNNVDTGGLWNGGELVFDKDKTIFKQQDGNLTLSLAELGNKNARSIILTVNGNNINTLTIPESFRNLNGGEFDNSKLNILNLTFVEQIGSTQLVYYTLNTTAALDNVGPVISGFILENSNTYVDVEFNEGVYTNVGATSPIIPADFQVIFVGNGGEATNVTISAVTKTDNTALVGGESTIRCVLDITGNPVGVETINVQVSSGTAIYDSFGNPANASEATGVITLKGDFSDSYINVLNKANERGDTKPLIADQQKEDTFINTLFDEGILDKSLILYNLKTGGDADYSKINWADPDAFDLLEIGTPVFNAKQGWRNNGSGNALNTQWIKGTSFNGNLSLHVKTTEMGKGTLNQPMGARSSSSARILIQPWNNGDQFTVAGGGSVGVVEDNVTESNTFMSVTFDGTNARLYKDGVLINTISLANNTNVPIALYLLAYNNGGSPFGEIPDTVDVEFAAVTQFLTDAECLALYNAWDTYNTAL